MVLLVLACAKEDPGSDTPRPPLHDSGDVADTDVPEPCAADPGLVVTGVEATQPWTAHELEVAIELSAPAAVALTCTLAGDPDEVHLAEVTEARSRHRLRLGGLLAESAYSCRVAPTCPESASAPVDFEVRTGEDPEEMIAPVARRWSEDASSEYVLTNLSDDCDWPTQLLVAWDRDARPRWYHRTPDWVGPSVEFRYHGDDTFAWGGGWQPNEEGRPRLVDLYEGEIYDSAAAMPDYRRSGYHHDGKRLDDGRLATLEETIVSSDEGGFKGFTVRVIDPASDAVDLTYDGQLAYDEGHLPHGSGDAWHANWVDLQAVEDTEVLYVSLCFLYWTVAVDARTGAWRWAFGRDGDFTLTDAEGVELPTSEFPQCQHGLEIEGDRLLVYDNGWERGQSRVVEYQLDEATMTARKLWEWSEPDWYESTLGDADYLPNGHILVGAGHAECFSTNPGDVTTVYEIDPATGTKLWEMQYPDSAQMAYRADWADPCALFANAKYCPAVAERVAELAPILGG